MKIWVNGVDRVIDLISETEDHENRKVNELYRHRGITYAEYYYLFSNQIPEEDFFQYPAYIYTRTYSKDHRIRRFGHLEYSPDSYKTFILQQELIPSQYFNQPTKANMSLSAIMGHSYCVAKTRSGKIMLFCVSNPSCSPVTRGRNML